MKILVTGSSGHLGAGLMQTLRHRDVEVIGTDILASAFTDQVGSITDRAHVRRCIQGADAVLHTATLHKPHVATHTKQDFIDTNVTGTLNLLEEAVLAGVRAFIFTSTTSTFGDAMNPKADGSAVWVTEGLVPVPKNIYGVTKLAAENLCQLFARTHQLPCLILKTSRFFPEADDSKAVRESYEDGNAKANEFLHRRVDVADVIDAHLLALETAAEIGFGRYIISATTPFTQADLAELNRDAPAVLKRLIPDYEAAYAELGWKLSPKIGRVYVNAKARDELGWRPQHNFVDVLDRVKSGGKLLSALAYEIGAKGYHETQFADGPYPVDD